MPFGYGTAAVSRRKSCERAEFTAAEGTGTLRCAAASTAVRTTDSWDEQDGGADQHVDHRAELRERARHGAIGAVMREVPESVADPTGRDPYRREPVRRSVHGRARRTGGLQRATPHAVVRPACRAYAGSVRAPSPARGGGAVAGEYRRADRRGGGALRFRLGRDAAAVLRAALRRAARALSRDRGQEQAGRADHRLIRRRVTYRRSLFRFATARDHDRFHQVPTDETAFAQAVAARLRHPAKTPIRERKQEITFSSRDFWVLQRYDYTERPSSPNNRHRARYGRAVRPHRHGPGLRRRDLDGFIDLGARRGRVDLRGNGGELADDNSTSAASADNSRFLIAISIFPSSIRKTPRDRVRGQRLSAARPARTGSGTPNHRRAAAQSAADSGTAGFARRKHTGSGSGRLL
ncbi:hypothetical protein APR12_003216 [Nocardia amikacinitolerans]|nr:hypothetical protein [Nocardia amikacinitolerans]